MKHTLMTKIHRLFGRTAYLCIQEEVDEVKNTPVKELFERCVLCGELTPIPVSTPIGLREFYEDGCGQLCGDCHQKVYRVVDQDNVLTNEQIMMAIEQSRKQT